MSVMLWGQVHGLVSLYNDNRLDMFKLRKDVRGVIDDAFQVFTQILGTYKIQ